MQQIIIRALDILLAVIALLLLSPVFLVLMLLVFFDLGLAVFFVQKRLGHNGKPFKMVKFRSMRNVELAQDHQFETVNKYAIKLRNDPRITPLGAFIRRTSLDELPQLLNVLCGQMSLVGPRPWVPQEYDLFPKAWFSRLVTKPGITGLAQISGRSDLPTDQAVALDDEWAARYSVSFYIEILFKTVFSVLRGKNTY